MTDELEVTEEETDESEVVGEGALDEDDESDVEARDRDTRSLELVIVASECEADEKGWLLQS